MDFAILILIGVALMVVALVLANNGRGISNLVIWLSAIGFTLVGAGWFFMFCTFLIVPVLFGELPQHVLPVLLSGLAIVVFFSCLFSKHEELERNAEVHTAVYGEEEKKPKYVSEQVESTVPIKSVSFVHDGGPADSGMYVLVDADGNQETYFTGIGGFEVAELEQGGTQRLETLTVVDEDGDGKRITKTVTRLYMPSAK